MHVTGVKYSVSIAGQYSMERTTPSPLEEQPAGQEADVTVVQKDICGSAGEEVEDSASTTVTASSPTTAGASTDTERSPGEGARENLPTTADKRESLPELRSEESVNVKDEEGEGDGEGGKKDDGEGVEGGGGEEEEEDSVQVEVGRCLYDVHVFTQLNNELGRRC